MDDRERLRIIAQWLDEEWTTTQVDRLLAFTKYLRGEGIESGGVGPHEVDRMIDRHVGDSLAYLTAMESEHGSLIDVGSGAGLPGIPMAIVRPDVIVTLLDRSQRRTDLAGRAVRILGLDNVTVTTGDVSDTKGSWDVVVFRASLGTSDAALAFRQLSSSGGIGILGVSRLSDRPNIPDPPPGIAFDLHREAVGVLDSPAWLLRMRHL